jgi:hypothetical protein
MLGILPSQLYLLNLHLYIDFLVPRVWPREVATIPILIQTNTGR